MTEVEPRFLLVKRKDDNFEKVSPFVISKTLYGLIGETKNVKKVKDGILVETKSNSQSKRLLQVKKFGEYIVEVIPHNTLNTCKGVIFCRDLLNCTIEEITEELQDQGVVDVRRLKTKRNGTLVETANHVLTFKRPNLPKEIKAAFHLLNVRPYIPQPTRCFNCQKIGHPASRCARIRTCPCGLVHDDSVSCRDPKKCVNCGGEHSAAYLNCPRMKEEAAIQKIKVIEKVSYTEAKQKLKIQTPKPNVSYASATTSQIQNHPKKPSDVITQPTYKDPTISSTSAQQTTSQIIPTDLLSKIENIVKMTLVNYLPRSDFRMPIHEPYRRDRSDSVSTNTSLVSEKRKKPDTLTSEEDDEENSFNKKKKKTKGWPKGKPRK